MISEDPRPAGDVLVRLRAARPQLQPAEQRVSAVVLGNPARVAHLSITELAEAASTSVATVARFARKIGFDGYPDLRIALAGAAAREVALGNGTPPQPAELDESASLADVVSTIVHHESRALQETADQLDLAAVQRAIDLVAGAQRIDIFGVGTSANVASDFQDKLVWIGKIAFAWRDAHAAMTSAALLDRTSVAIGISHGGSTPDVVAPLQRAKASGAATIALTNFASSPLARTADVVLTTASRETTFRAGDTASRIAQLAVIDILFVGVARVDIAASTKALSKTFEAVTDWRARGD